MMILSGKGQILLEILHILLVSTGSVIVLFVLTKIIGNRQMSQLSMFDYINGITIGSIAAEMATSLEDDFLKPLTAMIVYTALAVLISFLNEKSLRLRRLLAGTSLILLDNGKLYRKNFKSARLDMNEFLVQCRNAGYFNLSDIQTAVLEPNGRISFLPASEKRPATPEDLNLSPQQEYVVSNVVMDGKILHRNLKSTGNNEEWLRTQLSNQKIPLREVFLAVCDHDNNLTVYRRREKATTKDPFL